MRGRAPVIVGESSCTQQRACYSGCCIQLSVCSLVFVHVFTCVCTRDAADTNIALHKPAYQSSTHRYGHARKAVDDNANGDWYGNACTHTLPEKTPWWAVDLGAEHPIVQVQVTNRFDCCRKYQCISSVGQAPGVLNVLATASRGGSSATVPLVDRPVETWICQFIPRHE